MQTLGTKRLSWQKLLAANTTAATITNGLPTITKPAAAAGVGVIDFVGEGNESIQNNLLLSFFGERSAADNETFTARVEGWRRLGDGLWVPVPLLNLTLTMGTAVGVAGQGIINTEYLADTVVASAAFTSAYELISPADNSVALVKVDLFGCDLVCVRLAKGTCAKCNAVWAGF